MKRLQGQVSDHLFPLGQRVWLLDLAVLELFLINNSKINAHWTVKLHWMVGMTSS